MLEFNWKNDAFNFNSNTYNTPYLARISPSAWISRIEIMIMRYATTPLYVQYIPPIHTPPLIMYIYTHYMYMYMYTLSAYTCISFHWFIDWCFTTSMKELIIKGVPFYYKWFVPH